MRWWQWAIAWRDRAGCRRNRLAPDNPIRDDAMAGLMRRYMDFCWPIRSSLHCFLGLVDHHSWLQTRNMRDDGALKRPTLYDPSYQPKRMRQAIADACGGAGRTLIGTGERGRGGRRRRL